MSVVSFKNRQKHDVTVNLQDLTCILVTITIFLSIDPFFAWSSFAGGIGVTVFKALQVLTTVMMILMLKKISLPAFFCGLGVLGIFFFYCFFTGVQSGTTHPLLIGNFLIYFFYALCAMSNREILLKSFSMLRTLFAVILGYTLIIHVLLLLQIPLPYAVMQSGEAGRVEAGFQFYHNYLGCILINQNGSILYRFTSVFTEPGVVGTFCAFFLCAGDVTFKKNKKNIIFLISGILSLSVAFYIMLVFICAMKAWRKGGYKLLAALAAIFAVYVVFMCINFSNPMLTDLQERLTITETGLAGDNRIKDAAEAAYQAFLQSDLKTVLLGYGYPDSKLAAEAWQQTASYKESVYCLGFLGYGLMIAWFILTPLLCFKSKYRKENQAMYAYIALFVLSQYQRPYMKSLFLAYILLAGCLYIQQSARELDVSYPQET